MKASRWIARHKSLSQLLIVLALTVFVVTPITLERLDFELWKDGVVFLPAKLYWWVIAYNRQFQEIKINPVTKTAIPRATAHSIVAIIAIMLVEWLPIKCE